MIIPKQRLKNRSLALRRMPCSTHTKCRKLHFPKASRLLAWILEKTTLWPGKYRWQIYNLFKHLILIQTSKELGFETIEFFFSLNFICSGGNDGILRCFDLRKTSSPVLSLQKHQHWIYSLQYNKFNDQYVLSSGSDHAVVLYNVYSFSSTKDATLNKGMKRETHWKNFIFEKNRRWWCGKYKKQQFHFNER